MEEKSRIGAAGILQRIVGAALAVIAGTVALIWRQMPYLHHDLYGNEGNLILHLILFALCPILCVLTFFFAEKNRKLCFIGGAAVLAMAVAGTLANGGFLPYAGTLILGFTSILYLLAAFLAARPEKPETGTPEELRKKFRTARAVAVVSGIVAAFSAVFPKKASFFSQHMTDAGPGVIEYYDQYTAFGIVLLVLLPVSLILLIVFASRAGLLRGRLKKAENADR